METASPSQALRATSLAADPLLRQGDARWADRPPRWREHQLVLPWPEELLGRFSLRMAGHGMSISRAHMLGDPAYALQQLAHARAMDDLELQTMAHELFRIYVAHQSGLSPRQH